MAIHGDDYWDLDSDVPFFTTEPTLVIIFLLEEAVTIIVAMILIRKWTLEWNKKIESTEK